MKFKKIILLGYNGKEMEQVYWDKMDKLTKEKVFLSSDDSNLNKHLEDADCLLVRLGAKVGKDMINKISGLKYIGMLGTGVGGIDIDHARKKGIAVCNITDYATQGVAEFTLGVIIEQLRELERAKVQARKGDYSEATYTGTEIGGKNFGVIGLGNIGKKTAEIALGFGANVSYWSKNRKSDAEKRGIKYLNLKQLLKTSDIIIINVSLNSKTEGLLSREKIKLIKKGALLVNPSPMELVDLGAIVQRLKKGDLTFILDHSDEMTEGQLRKLKPYKNCVIYPPITYTTNEATSLKKGIFVDNLESFLEGTPINKVN